MRKKLLAVLLCIIMILTLMPSMALADGETPPEIIDPANVVTQSEDGNDDNKDSINEDGNNEDGAPSGEDMDTNDASDEDTSTLEVTLPTMRSGETILDISRGNITIGDGTIIGVDDGGNNVNTTNPNGYIITGTGTTNTVTVTGGPHNITLRDANIGASSSTSTAFDISTGATVNLTLEGTNTLTGGDSIFGGFAGLQVPDGATVNITGQSDGSGSLTATGTNGSAGIGGNLGGAGGTVTISGGNVIATGAGGAGIGGGSGGAGGTVIISGGNVTATGADGGAGIGGGYGTTGTGGSATISGGNVTATGASGGAGIGGGYTADGGTVNISGGNVIAIGAADGGAGIGGGREASGGAVIITGGNIKATGQGGALNIGKGASNTGLTDGTLTNGSTDVCLTTITLDGAAAATPISDPGTGSYAYGVDDVTTLDTNKLYFYLPTAATVNGVTTGTTPEQLYMESSPITGGTAGTLRLAGAAIADVTVSGTKDAALTPQDATITLTTETFNVLAADTDVSAWFTNMPAGLTAKIKTAVAANATSAVVTFTGTPTAESTAVMTVVLPKADLSSGLADMTVTTNNNAKWSVSAFTSAISFTTQPAAASVTEGNITGDLSAAATVNPSGTPTLTWYPCDAGGTVSGASLATGGTCPIPTTLTAGTYYYVCEATYTGAAPVKSTVAAVTVAAPAASSIRFTTQPASATVRAGSITGSLTAAAVVSPSGTPTLNWYVCDSNGVPTGTSLAAGGTLTIPTTLTEGTYYYLCQATYPGATAVNSVVAKVNVVSATAPPITGDNSQGALWLLVALFSGIGLPACLIVRRKYSNGY